MSFVLWYPEQDRYPPGDPEITMLINKVEEIISAFANDFSWDEACSNGPGGAIDLETMANYQLVHKYLIGPAYNLMKELERRPEAPGNTKSCCCWCLTRPQTF